MQTFIVIISISAYPLFVISSAIYDVLKVESEQDKREIQEKERRIKELNNNNYTNIPQDISSLINEIGNID